MGLAERKLRAEIETTKIPNAIKSLKFAHPYATVAIEVDFANFENDPDLMKWFHSNFSSLWSPLDFAFKKIGGDKIGKEAIGSGVKVLKFVHSPELPDTRYTLKDGTLLVEIPLQQKKLTTLPGVHDALMAGL